MSEHKLSVKRRARLVRRALALDDNKGISQEFLEGLGDELLKIMAGEASDKVINRYRSLNHYESKSCEADLQGRDPYGFSSDDLKELEEQEARVREIMTKRGLIP